MHRASDTLSDPDRNLAESTASPANMSDLDLIAEDSHTPATQSNTPPPRIAARFYRPTENRRKSSAASSRRNSMSSAHSAAQSQTSCRHGAQSNYVAQHLRRASIIEDRKARLADRAAHAEKVRLRAALAKAAPRSTSNSEERALAAEHAREKKLAEIVASCAEEVKRAKGIAESMKEKRDLEGKKLRREMEERLADAEKRREEILNRGVGAKRARSTSMPRKSLSPVREVKMKDALSLEAAAVRIQRRWRKHKKWLALKEFVDLGITIDGVRETLFEDVSQLLAQEKVLLSTGQALRICGLKEGESGSVNEMTAVKTFLSAYVILGHPAQVLSSKAGDSEQQEQDLVGKARDLLISFETALSTLNAGNDYHPPPKLLFKLSEDYATYYNAFIAWKARDSATLIDMMVLQFVELDSIWQTVKDSTEEAVTDSYRDGIRYNQVQLIARIKRLAGEARGKRLIATAMREARKARPKKKLTGDSIPRAAEAVAADLDVSEHIVTSQLQTLTPPSTPPRKSVAVNNDAEKLRTAASILPENRILVHELAINQAYRIEKEDCGEQIAVNQLIFDSMRQAVASGNSDPWVLAMADNVKGKLQRLLKPGNSLYVLLEQTLDSDLIVRELQSGTFSYEKFFSFVASILPRLAAPVRDPEIKTLIEVTFQNEDLVTRLQALISIIDDMRMDYANFMLQQSAPELIKNAAAYEIKCFAEIMKAQNNDIPRTRAAWTTARTKVFAEAARRDPENVNLARSRPTTEKIYLHMLVDLCATPSVTEIPETLELDVKRITRIRSDILRIVATSAILIQSKNLLKRDVRVQWKTEAQRILNVLENAKSSEQAQAGIQAALESRQSMPSATKNHIRVLVQKIVEATARVAAGEDVSEPVMRLLVSRVKSYLLGRLAKERVGPLLPAGLGDAGASASAGAGAGAPLVGGHTTGYGGTDGSLANLGMPEWVGRLGEVVEVLGNVARVDREGHGSVYEAVEGLHGL